jgi:23S rRNA (pseudouridine1915-N3)-methyltransferase
MRVVIAAVGRLKDGPERLLFEKYRDRFEAAGRRLGLSPVLWGETPESQAATADKRKTAEGAALRKLAGGAETLIALHLRGKSYTSEGFAQLLARIRDDGTKAMAFAIGGPDGLSADILATAGHTLSFGAMTLPHQLARIVLAEQLYRAATILAGHPYHRP